MTARLNKRRREGEGGRLAHQAWRQPFSSWRFWQWPYGHVLRPAVHPRSLLLLLLLFSAVEGEALADWALLSILPCAEQNHGHRTLRQMVSSLAFDLINTFKTRHGRRLLLGGAREGWPRLAPRATAYARRVEANEVTGGGTAQVPVPACCSPAAVSTATPLRPSSRKSGAAVRRRHVRRLRATRCVSSKGTTAGCASREESGEGLAPHPRRS
jgi:hypothetical protein